MHNFDKKSQKLPRARDSAPRPSCLQRLESLPRH